MRAGLVISAGALALTALAGCERGGAATGADTHAGSAVTDDASASPWTSNPGGLVPTQTQVRGNTDAGAAVANRVVATDPEQRYIVDAFVRDERVLGLTVSPTMAREQVDEALRASLTAMQKAFPGRRVEAIAYDESGHQLLRLVWNAERGEAEAHWRR
jgi:hypothetical protein